MSEKQTADEIRKELAEQRAEIKVAQNAIAEDLKAMAIERKKMAKHIEAFEVAKGRDFTLDEIRDGQHHEGIEVVSPQDFYDTSDKVAAELFMNELVKVNVPISDVQGALPIVVITVNGTNQPIIRGRDQVIKRKYIEAMARSRITTYKQEVPDPSKPDVITMKETTVLTYGFSVIEDKNKNGAAWLVDILNQP